MDTLSLTSEYVTLIHPKGALDRDAMAREVERRVETTRVDLIAKEYDDKWIAALTKQSREIATYRVENEAVLQRLPFVVKALQYCSTRDELRELERLNLAKDTCAISGPGNADFNTILGMIDVIHERQWQRAVEAVEGTRSDEKEIVR